jgi:hypothetical protein
MNPRGNSHKERRGGREIRISLLTRSRLTREKTTPKNRLPKRRGSSPTSHQPRKKKERPATPAITVLASNVVNKPDSLAITSKPFSAASSVVDLTEDKPQYLQVGENAYGLYSIFYILHTMSMSTSLTNMLS